MMSFMSPNRQKIIWDAGVVLWTHVALSHLDSKVGECGKTNINQSDIFPALFLVCLIDLYFVV